MTDPSQPDLSDANKGSVKLESISNTGNRLDTIERVRMDQFQGPLAQSKSRGDWMVAVTDGVDDGRVPAKRESSASTPGATTIRFGGGSDGATDDPTIETRLGGHLQVTYRNVAKNITIGPVQIPMSPGRRQLRVRAYKVTDANGVSKWTDDDIRRVLKVSTGGSTEGPTAADIWASASVDLVMLNHDAITDVKEIRPQAGVPWNIPAMAACPQPPARPICTLSNDYTSLIAERNNLDDLDDVVSLFSWTTSKRWRLQPVIGLRRALLGRRLSISGSISTQRRRCRRA